jgi:hypothetical protein
MLSFMTTIQSTDIHTLRQPLLAQLPLERREPPRKVQLRYAIYGSRIINMFIVVNTFQATAAAAIVAPDTGSAANTTSGKDVESIVQSLTGIDIGNIRVRDESQIEARHHKQAAAGAAVRLRLYLHKRLLMKSQASTANTAATANTAGAANVRTPLSRRNKVYCSCFLRPQQQMAQQLQRQERQARPGRL